MALANWAASDCDAGPQDVGEAEQQRQADALGVEIHRELVEVEPALAIARRDGR